MNRAFWKALLHARRPILINTAWSLWVNVNHAWLPAAHGVAKQNHADNVPFPTSCGTSGAKLSPAMPGGAAGRLL